MAEQLNKMTEQFNEIKIETQSLFKKTGYKCKDCDDTVFGYYKLLNTKMYFHCKCKCSNWLVRATHLNKTFNKELSVFVI